MRQEHDEHERKCKEALEFYQKTQTEKRERFEQRNISADESVSSLQCWLFLNSLFLLPRCHESENEAIMLLHFSLVYLINIYISGYVSKTKASRKGSKNRRTKPPQEGVIHHPQRPIGI
eukprot:TRINITY_DN2747_c0_g2_i8.p1 TRINITY_DN2747_c0_g2~~TRINITY_DN2747_c0_g2_i8.p1  ORF type:complete len:134 (-),score=11.68 TRINITY_DN2747_c0_g2_i8:524-880(-)